MHLTLRGACEHLKSVQWTAFLVHLRMRPVSGGNSRLAMCEVPRAERPRFSGPVLIRTRCPDTSSKATL